MKPYPIIKKETILDHKYCTIEKHLVKLPNGKEGDWFVEVNNDAVIVLPILESGEVLLQKTYKHGAGEIIIETCAGLVDDGEQPVDAAHRELLEETGYKAAEMTFLDTVFANPTGSNMKYHFFIAKDCKKVAEQQLDDAEQIENFTVKNIQELKKFLTQKDIITTAATRAMLSYV